MRLMLFREGRYPRYAFPVLAEYIRPNVYPRKSKVLTSLPVPCRFVSSSLTVSFSLPMISRSRSQRLFGFASPAQDHEVVLRRSNHLAESRDFAPARASSIPAQPAHVEIRQQW